MQSKSCYVTLTSVYFYNHSSTKETNHNVQLAADLRRDFLPSTVHHTDTVITGLLLLMSCFFPLWMPYTMYWQHTFQCLSKCWKTCASSLNGGIVCSPHLHYVTLWQQRYAAAVICFGQNGLHGERTKPQKLFQLINQCPTSTANGCPGLCLPLVRMSTLWKRQEL